jgi:hypothetical protein
MHSARLSGMATKAEQFRANEQRSHQKPKAVSRDRRLDGSLPGKLESGDSARRNLKTSPTHQKGGPALESSLGKPSRKSTRSSTGRIKLASNLQRRAVRRTHSSQARAERASAQRAG